MESRKMILMNLFAGQEQRYRHREKTLDIAGEGEGEMYGSVTWKLTLPYVNEIANEKLLYNTGS